MLLHDPVVNPFEADDEVLPHGKILGDAGLPRISPVSVLMTFSFGAA